MFDQTRIPLGSKISPRANALILLAIGVINLLQALSDRRSSFWFQLILAIAILLTGGWALWHARRVRRLPEDAPGPWVQDAKGRLAAGDRIGAITVVREATGLGAADATTLVASWER